MKQNMQFQENIHFHTSYKSLHEHVDPEALPEEYGGTAGPFENSNCQKAIQVQVMCMFDDDNG